jgi:putative PEP-CTERM system TPR-repeat lipoprotein
MDPAREALERAVELSPRHFQSVFLLAVVDARLGNENRARQLAEQAVGIQPGFIPARKLLATWHLRDRKGREAEEMVRPIVQARGDDLEAKNMLAAALIAQGRGEEAAALLQSIAEQQPDSPLAQLRAGLGLLSAGDADAAVAALNRAAEVAPQDPDINAALVGGLLQQRETETALARAREFLERNPDSPPAMNLVAAAELAAGNRAAAVAAYERTLATDPANLKALQMLATLALADKANEAALARTSEGLSAHPDDLQLLLLQAAAARAAGDADLNRSTLQRAVEAHPQQLGPKALLARQLLEDGQAEQALAVVSGVNAGGHSGVLAARAEAYHRLNRLDEARTDLEALAAIMPDSLDLQAQLARTYEALNDRAGLERTLNRMLALAPDDPSVALSKARLAIASGRPAEARALLDSEMLAGREELAVVTTRAALARAERDGGAEVRYTRRLVELQPSSLHTVMLSRALQRNGDAEQAEQVLSGWLAGHEADVAVLAELANLHVGRGEIDTSIGYLRRIVAADPNNVYALNNLAWYLRQSSTLEARRFAERLIELAPNEPTIVDTYAAVLAEARDYPTALRALDRAIDRGRDVEALRLRRAETLHQSGDTAAAIQELERVLNSAPPPAVKARAEKMLAELVPPEG